jgi:hypothetical protein
MHPAVPNHAGRIWSVMSGSSWAAWFGPLMPQLAVSNEKGFIVLPKTILIIVCVLVSPVPTLLAAEANPPILRTSQFDQQWLDTVVSIERKHEPDTRHRLAVVLRESVEARIANVRPGASQVRT